MDIDDEKALNLRLPKYKQIALDLREEIFGGFLKSGCRLESVRELAARYDTTKATIQQALALLADEGLVDRRQGSGVFVKSLCSKTLAIVFDRQITDPNTTLYCSHLLAGVEKFLEGTGWNHRCYIDVSSRAAAEEFEKAVSTHRFGGLIVASRWVAEGYISELTRLGVPCIGAYPYSTLDHWIFFDYQECSLKGVCALADRGARRIALIAGEDPQGIHQEMEKGYCRGLARACRQIDDDLIQVVPMTEEDGFQAFKSLWSRPIRPDGIMVTDELITRGVIRGIISHGVKVPEELCIASQVGYVSENPFAIGVIQVQMDVVEQASRLVQMMFERLAGGSVSESRILLSPKIYNPFGEEV